MQNAQAKMFELKHEEHIPEEVYEEEIIKDEVIQEEHPEMKVVIYENPEVMEEDENYITYEVDEENEAAVAYLEEYEQVEYLESDAHSQCYENIEYDDEPNILTNHVCAYCKPEITFKTDRGLERHLYEEHQIGSSK